MPCSYERNEVCESTSLSEDIFVVSLLKMKENNTTVWLYEDENCQVAFDKEKKSVENFQQLEWQAEMYGCGQPRAWVTKLRSL